MVIINIFTKPLQKACSFHNNGYILQGYFLSPGQKEPVYTIFIKIGWNSHHLHLPLLRCLCLKVTEIALDTSESILMYFVGLVITESFSFTAEIGFEYVGVLPNKQMTFHVRLEKEYFPIVSKQQRHVDMCAFDPMNGHDGCDGHI